VTALDADIPREIAPTVIGIDDRLAQLAKQRSIAFESSELTLQLFQNRLRFRVSQGATLSGIQALNGVSPYKKSPRLLKPGRSVACLCVEERLLFVIRGPGVRFRIQLVRTHAFFLKP